MDRLGAVAYKGNLAGAAKLLSPLLAIVCATIGRTQPPTELTLPRAKEIALRNHPRIRSASLTAAATQTTVAQARAAFYPMLSGSVTGAGAPDNSAVAAGNITTSSLSSRFATALTVSQLITDFGRTSSLAASAGLKAAAQNRAVDTTRAEVVLRVEQAYFQALGAAAVLKVAQASLDNRKLTLRQVKALAESSFKSTLDVSFAEVAVSEAELELYRAENDVAAGQASLGAALGYESDERFALADEPMPPPLDPDAQALVTHAIKNRPDLATLALNRDAALRQADAEKRLSYPTISVLGAAGEIPEHLATFRSNYGAAGLNVTIPVLNGGLFAARRNEAELKARAAGADVESLGVQVARDVRLAWLEANTAFRRIDVTVRLVAETDQALRLAQVRYDNGLGSIVELNQAQLNQTSAQIQAAAARYEYMIRRAALDFAMGDLP